MSIAKQLSLSFLILSFLFCISCRSRYEILGEYKLIRSGDFPATILPGEYIRLESLKGEIRCVSTYFQAGNLIRDTFLLNKIIELSRGKSWVCTDRVKYDSTRYLYTLRESDYHKLKQNLTLRVDNFYTLILSRDTSIIRVIKNDTVRSMYFRSMTKLAETDQYIYYNNLIRLEGMSKNHFSSWDTCIKISGKDIYDALKINRKYLRRVRFEYNFTASPYIQYYSLINRNLTSPDSLFK